MSGKPSQQGVTKFKWAMFKMAKHGTAMRKAQEEAANWAAVFRQEKEEYEAARRQLFELMDEMDVASNRNDGYAERAVWFFEELQRQVERDAEDREKVLKLQDMGRQ